MYISEDDRTLLLLKMIEHCAVEDDRTLLLLLLKNGTGARLSDHESKDDFALRGGTAARTKPRWNSADCNYRVDA